MYPNEPDLPQTLAALFKEHATENDFQQIAVLLKRFPGHPAQVLGELNKIIFRSAEECVEATDFLTDMRFGLIWGGEALAKWDAERRAHNG